MRARIACSLYVLKFRLPGLRSALEFGARRA